MKKMGKTAAAKFMKSFSKKFDNVEHIVYEIEDDKFEIEINTDISATDLYKLIRVAEISTYIDGKRNYFYRDCTVAKYIIDELTNIPVPSFKITTEKNQSTDVEDLKACYDIVFGFDGLYDRSYNLSRLIDRIYDVYSNDAINDDIYRNMPINTIASKAMELYEYTKASLNDIVENNVVLDDLVKLIDDHLDKNGDE